MQILDFIRNEILKLDFLNQAISNFLLALGLNQNEKAFKIIHFFIYDSIKILFFIFFLIFVISFIQSYFPPERTKEILSKFKGIKANIMAAMLGAVTPFCSCSSIPLFIGFKSAGIKNSVAFSFLISSPMIDLAALAMLSSAFGFKTAIAYIIFGLIIAVVGGVIIGKLKMDNQIEDFIRNGNFNNINSQKNEISIAQRLSYAKSQTLQTFKKIFIFVLIGVGIGAFIHNIIPQNLIESILGKNNSFSVIYATIVGIPVYADVFGTIPIAKSLLSKNAGLGTTLAFMMAVTTLSLPSMIMLRRAIKPKLLATFISIVTIGTILVGYFFNIFSNYFIK